MDNTGTTKSEATDAPTGTKASGLDVSSTDDSASRSVGSLFALNEAIAAVKAEPISEVSFAWLKTDLTARFGTLLVSATEANVRDANKFGVTPTHQFRLADSGRALSVFVDGGARVTPSEVGTRTKQLFDTMQHNKARGEFTLLVVAEPATDNTAHVQHMGRVIRADELAFGDGYGATKIGTDVDRQFDLALNGVVLAVWQQQGEPMPGAKTNAERRMARAIEIVPAERPGRSDQDLKPAPLAFDRVVSKPKLFLKIETELRARMAGDYLRGAPAGLRFDSNGKPSEDHVFEVAQEGFTINLRVRRNCKVNAGQLADRVMQLAASVSGANAVGSYTLEVIPGNKTPDMRHARMVGNRVQLDELAVRVDPANPSNKLAADNEFKATTDQALVKWARAGRAATPNA